MKKLFMFLAVAGLATFGASCSSSDDNGGKDPGTDPGKEPGKEKVLALTGPTSVETETAVKFTIKSEGKAVEGAEIYVDDAKVENPYTFEEEGTFNVVAKKAGFKDSNVLKVKVTKKKVVRKVTLTMDSTTINLGSKAIGTVKYEDDNSVATSFEVFLNDQSIGRLDNATTGRFEVTPNREGVYVFHAEVDGEPTNTVEVTVVDTTPATTGNIVYDGNSNTVAVQRFGLLEQGTQTQNLTVVQALTADNKHVVEFLVLVDYVIEDDKVVDIDFSKIQFLDYYYYDLTTEVDYDDSQKDADENTVITNFSITTDKVGIGSKTAVIAFEATTASGKVLKVDTANKFTQVNFGRDAGARTLNKSTFASKSKLSLNTVKAVRAAK